MASNDRADEFVSFMEAHKGIIYKIVNSYCQNADDRKDLSQEIVLKLWQTFDQFNGQFKYSTWMYKIALNVAISQYRTEKRRKNITNEFDDALLNIKDTSPENSEADNRTSLLYRCIGEFKPLDKALLVLYLEEKSYQEIAEILGITETNVATKIGRLKKKLKEKFSKI